MMMLIQVIKLNKINRLCFSRKSSERKSVNSFGKLVVTHNGVQIKLFQFFVKSKVAHGKRPSREVLILEQNTLHKIIVIQAPQAKNNFHYISYSNSKFYVTKNLLHNNYINLITFVAVVLFCVLILGQRRVFLCVQPLLP